MLLSALAEAQTITFPVGSAPTPGGSTTQIQFNNSGAFGGAANLAVKNGNLVLTNTSSSNPVVSNRVGVSQLDRFGGMTVDRYKMLPTPVHFNAAQVNRAAIWFGAGIATFGAATSVFGSSSEVVWSSGSPFSACRKRRLTSLSSANATAGYYEGAPEIYIGSTTYGGFKWGATAAMVSTDAHTAYFGLMEAVPGNSVTALSTMTNMIVVGLAPGDTNYKLYYNDGTGAANSIDLGANFPKGSSPQAWLNITLYSPRSGGFHYRVVNRTNGAVASGFVDTDVPSSAVVLRSVLWTSNGATGTPAFIEFVQVKYETYP